MNNVFFKAVFCFSLFIPCAQLNSKAIESKDRWCGPCSGIAAGYLREVSELASDLSLLVRKGNVILYFVNESNILLFNLTNQVSSVAKEYKNILFVKVDVQRFPELQKNYYVQKVPTLLMYKGGSIAHIVTGDIEKSELMRSIKKVYGF